MRGFRKVVAQEAAPEFRNGVWRVIVRDPLNPQIVLYRSTLRYRTEEQAQDAADKVFANDR